HDVTGSLSEISAFKAGCEKISGYACVNLL
ncbi:MAG: hypothetical protein ACI9BC_001712, partial [Crocinitomicaceae bacterium]